MISIWIVKNNRNTHLRKTISNFFHKIIYLKKICLYTTPEIKRVTDSPIMSTLQLKPKVIPQNDQLEL